MMRMRKDDNDLQISEVYQILKTRSISTGVIELYQKNNRIIDYLIDNKYILRISKSTLNEQIKQNRVKSVTLAPKIHASGSFTASGCDYYFLISDYVLGNDLYSALQELTDEQSIQIGKEIAKFLIELHSIKDSYYDIGHYVATIPRYKQSWKEGHLEYVEWLKNHISDMSLALKSKRIVSTAFDYIYQNVNCLEYQTGARVLHNDLHPKNIIIYEGKLAGIIDWECSQFGEADFELAHLFHWCIYPPKPSDRCELLLKSCFENFMVTMNVPSIQERLTIYQLEHELNQLIWNGKKQEEERMRRITGWLNGQVDTLLQKWQFS